MFFFLFWWKRFPSASRKQNWKANNRKKLVIEHRIRANCASGCERINSVLRYCVLSKFAVALIRGATDWKMDIKKSWTVARKTAGTYTTQRQRKIFYQTHTHTHRLPETHSSKVNTHITLLHTTTEYTFSGASIIAFLLVRSKSPMNIEKHFTRQQGKAGAGGMSVQWNYQRSCMYNIRSTSFIVFFCSIVLLRIIQFDIPFERLQRTHAKKSTQPTFIYRRKKSSSFDWHIKLLRNAHNVISKRRAW